MSKKKPSANDRYVWRDADTGRLVSVVIADPVVKPTKISVEKIRKAVRDVIVNRRPAKLRFKRSAKRV